MAKTRGRPSGTKSGGTNQPGDPEHQPTAIDAEPVLSSADPRPMDQAELDTLRKKVEQLCIKVGI